MAFSSRAIAHYCAQGGVQLGESSFSAERHMLWVTEEGEVGGKGEAEERRVGIWQAYTQLWGVVRLPAVRELALLLLVFRLGCLPAEQAAPLKLLDKGVSKEALAGLVRMHA